MSDEGDQAIEELLSEGRHAEAAALCLEAGDGRRAAELFAAVWLWTEAIAAAESAGHFDEAYRHALAGDDRRACGRLLILLTDHPEQALNAAAAAEQKGRLVDAARLQEAAGELELAGELYRRSGDLFEAARCHEASGRYREAGMLYEKRVREDPADAEAALRLGRILASFGRYQHAARALQSAEKDEERAAAARPLLVACFAALGLDEAAGQCLARLRLEEPSAPVVVSEFLQERFGDERGIAGLSREGDAAQLLAGRYRVLSPLGAGATGRVLLAHDAFYDREVAVKVLSVATGAAGRDAYSRFAKEARVAAGLEHPNVVRVFEFNPDGPFLVMEHMAGGTLEDRLADAERATSRLPLAVTRHVVRSVLDGLEAVHRRGVIHRDVKPANVFFGAAGGVKLGDFGVAHLADLGATLTGALLGTLAYMSPEQITGSQRPDASTDLYAVGVILYRLVTGRLPFPGPDFVTQHLAGSPTPPGQLAPDVGARFETLLGRLLATEVEDRIRSAGEARALLALIDWTDDQEAVIVPAPRMSSAPPPAADEEERYVDVESVAEGVEKAWDAFLERPVWIERCEADRAARLRQLASCDSPYLQAVYEVDTELGRAILEAPQGAAASELGDSARGQAGVSVGKALARLHENGIGHGQLDWSRVLVGPGRVVLLLPTGSATAPVEADRERMDALGISAALELRARAALRRTPT